MSKYLEQKAKARQEAIDYQINKLGHTSMSYAELYEAQLYFEDLGRRFGLLKEFKENGII